MHPVLKKDQTAESGEWTRQDTVAFHLNVLALHVDPQRALLSKLAEAIEVDSVTLSRWKNQGFIPWHQVRRLLKKYGKRLVPADELCPVEYRRHK